VRVIDYKAQGRAQEILGVSKRESGFSGLQEAGSSLYDPTTVPKLLRLRAFTPRSVAARSRERRRGGSSGSSSGSAALRAPSV
jgi:hypothetical protein